MHIICIGKASLCSVESRAQVGLGEPGLEPVPSPDGRESIFIGKGQGCVAILCFYDRCILGFIQHGSIYPVWQQMQVTTWKYPNCTTFGSIPSQTSTSTASSSRG